VRAYTGSTAGVGPYLGEHYSYQLRQPFARLMNAYQRLVVFPGALFALILVVGLAGIVLPRRRLGAAALLWFSAVVSIVLPVAEHEYTYRYVVPAIPLACMAAALAFRDRSPASPAAAAGTVSAAAGDDEAGGGQAVTPESSGSAVRPLVSGMAADGR